MGSKWMFTLNFTLFRYFIWKYQNSKLDDIKLLTYV